MGLLQAAATHVALDAGLCRLFLPGLIVFAPCRSTVAHKCVMVLSLFRRMFQSTARLKSSACDQGRYDRTTTVAGGWSSADCGWELG